jgi:hypothetical protein
VLIGEFRRQALNERIAYVCPTRQLARQVGTQAQKYLTRQPRGFAQPLDTALDTVDTASS